MFELLFCAALTVLPDYLFRTRIQGKRWGRELSFFSIWYELRWGLTLCLLLTVALVTLIFYFHPSSSNVVSMFRTVSILPERMGRVEEVYVANDAKVKAGEPLFRLDDAQQQAQVETARRRLAELDAEAKLAESEISAADAQVRQAGNALDLAKLELSRSEEVNRRNANVVAQREIDRQRSIVESRESARAAALAKLESAQRRLEIAIPAQRASAEAQLDEAQVALEKSVVRAGVDGTLTQFTLRPGDVVNPMLRPAGILVPSDAGRERFVAGFDQISAQVLKMGMIGEVTCPSVPFEIIPVKVTSVQEVMASGQFRPTDMLADVAAQTAPGSVMVFMEPLFEDGAKAVPPGSRCIANAYTSNHARLANEDLGLGAYVFYHVVDTVGVIHAAILRSQALLLPVRTLVLSGH